MSTKPPSNDPSGFGDLEEDFFNSEASWDLPAGEAPPPAVVPAAEAGGRKKKGKKDDDGMLFAEALMAKAMAEQEAARAAAAAEAVSPPEQVESAPVAEAPTEIHTAPSPPVAVAVAEPVVNTLVTPLGDALPMDEERTEVIPPSEEPTDVEPPRTAESAAPIAVPVALPVAAADEALPDVSAQLVRRGRVLMGDARALLFLEATRHARAAGVPPTRALQILDEGGRPQSGALAWWRERAAVVEEIGLLDKLRDTLAGLGSASSGVTAAEAMLGAAVAARALGQGPAARRLAEQALRQAPDYIPALEFLVALTEGEAPAHVAALEALAAAQPGVAGAGAAVRRARLAGPGEAAAAWRAARAMDPGSLEIHAALEQVLVEQGDERGLAELLCDEADRIGGAHPVEAALLYARGAATWRAVEPDGARAERVWRQALAVAPQCEPVRRAWESFCLETGRHDEVITSVRDELVASGDAATSHQHWRLGNLLERRAGDRAAGLDDAARDSVLAEALAAYEVAARDPAAAPAAEAVLRLLQAQRRWSDVVAFLDARVERLDDPVVVVTVLYRMGETCEGPLDDPATARVHYERCLDVSPGYLPALEGLERVCSRTRAWDALAAVYEQRALLSDSPSQVALHRQRAGAVYEVRLNDVNRAREQYRLALEAVPDFAPSLDAYARALTELGDWSTLARVLRNAAAATRDSNEAVSLYYRSARVLVDRVGDVNAATECLERCLALSPAFAPALLLAKDISGAARGWDAYADFERAQASSSERGPRRAWRLYAAATAYLGSRGDDAAAIAQSLLDEQPGHDGAATVAQIVAIARGDVPAAAALYARLGATDRPLAPEWRARAAQLAASAGNAMELHRVVLDGVTAAPRLVAASALRLQLVEDAARALEDGGMAGDADAVRLRVAIRGPAPEVLAALAERVGAGDPGAARLAIELRAPCRGEAHRLLAAGLTGVAASSHLVMAAEAFEESGAVQDAGSAWSAAFDLDPRAGRAFDVVCAARIDAHDADGVRALYARLPATEQDGLGEALAAAGDTDAAIATWTEAATAAEEPLPWQLRIEGALEDAGRWAELFRALKVRMDTTDDMETRAANAARCRWLLAEKLAETDDAWHFYRDLHASDPTDRGVLEALARIAGVRGDEALAIRYFTQLADTATEASEAARIQRRVAELRERAGDPEGARAALTRALDVLPEDRDALAGLRRLATEAGDWQGVIGVLARESALEGAVGRLAKAIEIAEIWEQRVDDPRVAMDAWAKVLDLAPNDRNALEHLVGLADRTRDAQAFVLYGKPLSELLVDAERSALQARVAARLADDLRREDEAITWFDAATAGPFVDVSAAERLEAIHAARGAWDRVVDAILRRVRGVADPAVKVEALRRAARLAAENARDKALVGRVYALLIELDPDNVDAVRHRADACYEAGDDAAALPLLERLEPYERARDLDDFDTQVEVALYYYRYAEALRRQQRTDEAVARFERALELSPTHLPSLEAVGPIYLHRKDWKAAEKVYQKLLQLTGGLGDADQLTRLYTSLGRVELQLGQVDKARKRLVKALELRPNDVPALQAYGEVLYAAGEWSPLLVTYNNIIYYTQTPADVIDAYLRKGYILDTKMNLPPREPGMVPEGAARAAQHYEKSLAFDPAQPEALLRLAELALRREDWTEAGSYADRGLAVDTSAPVVRACLLLARALASQGTGDVGAAEQALAEIREHDAALSGQVGSTPVTDIATLVGILKARVTASPTLT